MRNLRNFKDRDLVRFEVPKKKSEVWNEVQDYILSNCPDLYTRLHGGLSYLNITLFSDFTKYSREEVSEAFGESLGKLESSLLQNSRQLNFAIPLDKNTITHNGQIYVKENQTWRLKDFEVSEYRIFKDHWEFQVNGIDFNLSLDKKSTLEPKKVYELFELALQGDSVELISEKLDLSDSSVRSYLAKANITLSQREAKRL